MSMPTPREPAALDLTAQDKAVFENICGDFDMRIARDGTWFYRGSPIGRLPLVKLFSTVLKRDDKGEYWLITPVEKGRIAVDDAPFVAVELTISGAGKDQVLTMRTNLDEFVSVNDSHPIRVVHDPASGEPSPYVMVREGLEARINRPVYYQLMNLGEERDPDSDEDGESDGDGARIFGVWSNGTFFKLADAPAEGSV